jgi:hypothetical protein
MTTTTTTTKATLSCSDWKCTRKATSIYLDHPSGEQENPAAWSLICGQHRGGLMRQRWGRTFHPGDFYPIDSPVKVVADIVAAKQAAADQNAAERTAERRLDEARRTRRDAINYNASVKAYAPGSPWVVTRMVDSERSSRGERVCYVAHPVDEAPSIGNWSHWVATVNAPYTDLWGNRQLASVDMGSTTTGLNPYAAQARAQALLQASAESVARWPNGTDPDWPVAVEVPAVPEDES